MKPKNRRPQAKQLNGWKTCNRGHKFRCTGPCPKCWPGRAARRRDEK